MQKKTFVFKLQTQHGPIQTGISASSLRTAWRLIGVFAARHGGYISAIELV